jgi:hypothetical protein
MQLSSQSNLAKERKWLEPINWRLMIFLLLGYFALTAAEALAFTFVW